VKQAVLPLEIERPAPPPARVIPVLSALPVDLPVYPPGEQVNLLCRAAGLGGSADLWRINLQNRYGLLEFLGAAYGHTTAEMGETFRWREIRREICSAFNLEYFPVGHSSNWEYSYIREARDRITQSGYTLKPIKTSRAGKKLSPEQKTILQKRNAMKRVLKRYGFFAEQFIQQEWQRKEWEWVASDDELWSQEQAKLSRPRRSGKARRAARRKTDNDVFLGGGAV